MSFKPIVPAINLALLSLGLSGIFSPAILATPTSMGTSIGNGAIDSRSVAQQSAGSQQTDPVTPPTPAESPLETMPGHTGSGTTVPDPLDPPSRPNDPSNNVNGPTGGTSPVTPPVTTPGVPEGTAPAPTAPPESTPGQTNPSLNQPSGGQR